MNQPKPSIGRIVHYTLGEGDVTVIDQQSPMVVDGRQVRNSVHAGDVYPAVIVRVFGSECANLRVLLDGTVDYWATSRAFDDPEVERTPRYSPTPDHEGPGHAGATWHWPPRV
jgi:hypothetical protein